MNTNSIFIDLHCHPSMKPFYSSKVHSEKKNIWDFVPESKVCNKLPKFFKKQLGEMIRHSQVNLDNCLEGNLKVLFISLYPIERGWFKERKFPDFLIDDDHILNSAVCSSGLDKDVIADIRKTIDEDREINYFNELVGEYHYINSVQAKSDDNNKQFVIVNNFDEIKNILDNQDDKRIVMVVTIEGGHSLCKFDDYDDLKSTPFKKVDKRKFNDFDIYRKIYTEHIDIIKGKKDYDIEVDGNKHGVNFQHTPFYITFAHHFWNLLCGHSDSFGIGPDIMLNQGRGKKRSFTELGKIVLRKLLHRDNFERRILIDIKHMSISSRKEFYKMWENEYQSIGDGFPIISSHTAVNGRHDYHDPPSFEEGEKDEFDESFFNKSSINMFDPDIEMIHKSNGLFGLILNEARLPGSESRRLLKHNKRKIRKNPNSEQAGILRNENRQEYLKCITANIFHIARVINRKSAWDIITIGSDFDGMIDALDTYTMGKDFPLMAKELIDFINSCDGIEETGMSLTTMNSLKFGYTTEEIIEKIMNGNALSFMKKYFHDDFLKHGTVH
ncbi:MAG: dipeptidase [Bacteroidales bacterium]|nr:dipeptidase [Bacteroidales bacterium]